MQPRDRPLILRCVEIDYCFIHDTPGARAIPFQTFFERDVERDGYDREEVVTGYTEQAATRPRLQIRGVNHRQSSRREPDARNVMQQAERRSIDALIAFVITDHCAESVGRDDLSLFEVIRGEG